MRTTPLNYSSSLFLACLLLCANPLHAAPDWSSISSEQIVLFYPGQASWEWLLTKHSGAKSVRKGAPCLECHKGEEKEMGQVLVKAGPLEPMPINGKPGFIVADIQLASDKNNLYIRARWKDSGFQDDKPMDKDYASKFAVMLDDGGVKETRVAACWGVCHDDASRMRSAEEEKRDLYVSSSRSKLTRKGGGDRIVSADKLEQLLENKAFMEYWQVLLNNTGVAKINEGIILEKRHPRSQQLVTAHATHNNGQWEVLIERKRSSTIAQAKPLASGDKLILGFAIHDAHARGRFHYVSFGREFELN